MKFRIQVLAIVIGIVSSSCEKSCQSTHQQCESIPDSVCWEIEKTCTEYSVQPGGLIKSPHVFAVYKHDKDKNTVSRLISLSDEKDSTKGYKCSRFIKSANTHVAEACDSHPDFQKLMNIKDSVRFKPSPDLKHLVVEYKY